MYRRFVKLKIKFWWTIEDIYDNVCESYGLKNNGWYPSFHAENQLMINQLFLKWKPFIIRMVN